MTSPREPESPLVRVMLEIRHRRRFHRDGFTKPAKAPAVVLWTPETGDQP